MYNLFAMIADFLEQITLLSQIKESNAALRKMPSVVYYPLSLLIMTLLVLVILNMMLRLYYNF